MESSVEKEKGLKRKLEFIIPRDEVQICFSKNYKKLQMKAKIPGFRQGKVPIETLKQTHKDRAYEAVMQDLFQSFYPRVLKENQVRPAGPPVLIDLDLQEGKACKFLLKVEVHPEVKVENYLNLELKKTDINVTEKKVVEALEELRQSCAKFKDSLNKGPLKHGDFFLVNLEGFLSSEKQQKMSYPYLLLQAGKDRIAPGFDDKLIGLNLDEEKEFDFKFAQNYPDPKIAGLYLHIKVKLLGFKDKHIPELNDELAKQFKLRTLEELKTKIEEELRRKLKREAKEKMENALIRRLMEKNPVELPEGLIKEQKQKLRENARKKLEEYKMTKEEQEVFLKKEDFVFEKRAKEDLHSSYLIEQLVRDLKIETTKEDIRKSLQEAFPKEKPEDVEKKLKKSKYWDSFIFNLMKQKVIGYLMESANIVNGSLHHDPAQS